MSDKNKEHLQYDEQAAEETTNQLQEAYEDGTVTQEQENEEKK